MRIQRNLDKVTKMNTIVKKKLGKVLKTDKILKEKIFGNEKNLIKVVRTEQNLSHKNV